jgi:signal transduction histidine kinase
MSLVTFLEPAHLLQTVALALSIFNLVAFLWLAITVWLNGDRRGWIARLGVVGLGFSAFFFCIHALLIAEPLTQSAGFVSQDLLWRLLWLPAICVPYIWFAIGLHYAALINSGWRRRRPALLVSSGILGCLLLVILILYQSTFTFFGTIRLLTSSVLVGDSGDGLFSPAVLVPVLFLIYVTFCAIGPWFTPNRISRVTRALWTYASYRVGQGSSTSGNGSAGETGSDKKPRLRQALSESFWDDPTDVELLQEPVLSWHLARPGLFLAAVLMVGLTTILAIVGVWSIVDWFEFQKNSIPFLPAAPPLNAIPLHLLVLDTLATGVVALIILRVGYSVVRHGVLIERPLARRGFFEQWRGIVIVATTVALVIALLVDFTRTDLGSLLLITSVATGVYALFTWNSYTAHDRYIALLGPFIRSTNLRHWLNTDQKKTEQGLEDLFFHLCQDVLVVKCARMTVMAGSVRRVFSYRWPQGTKEQNMYFAPKLVPRSGYNGTTGVGNGATGVGNGAPARMRITVDGEPMICWVLPIYDELGLVAMLYLGPRQDGAVFTDEDMDLAHACGQRILDTLGDHEAMQAVAALLRRRIVDVKLLGAQQRRILHDDILPEMHLALLRLESLRSYVDTDKGSRQSKENSTVPPEEVLNEVAGLISDAHRRLASMMRATVPSAPHRLEREGLMNAIHTMLDQDFQQAFDEVDWCVSEETANCIDEVTPPAIAELIFAAVQESLRNAARHARGSDVHRRLRLTLKASCDRLDPHVEVIVSDDGVGIISASSSTTGTGGGLLTHSALLAIAGGSLTVKSAPAEGVTIRILLPAESLRQAAFSR